MANKLNFSRGLENNLPTPVDGTVRFCTDTGSLYIDNNEERIKINAGKADQLTEKRTISLTGAITGAVEFDGSTDVTMNTMSAMESTQLIEDSEIAYSKDLPVANVSKYATITEIGGMSYKCENLIPFPYNENTKTKNGITFTVNNDGSVLANGTADENYNVAFYLCENVMFSAGNYVLSGVPSGFKSEVTITLYYKDDSGEYIYVNVYSGGNITFTLTTSRQCTIYLQVFKGQSVSNLTFYPMLNKGESALPYQPYFEGLRDAKVTAIESVGANLFNIEANKKDSEKLYIYEYHLKPNTKYTVSSNCPQTTPATIYCNGGSTINNGVWQNRPVTTTTDENGYMYLEVRHTVSYEGDDFDIYSKLIDGTYWLQIEEGSIATEYKPYNSNIFEIPEAVQALEGYGQGISKEYYNKIVLDPASGVKKFVKATKTLVLSGEESIARVGTRQFAINIADASNSSYTINDAICSHFEYIVNSYGASQSGFVTNDSQLIIRYPEVAEDTSTAFQAYLAEQYAAGTPVTVEYVLAEPIETNLSDYFDEDNLIGIEAGGTITAVNEYKYDVPFTINYSYGKNYDVVSSKKFIGDLDGIATRAISDNNGNIIEKTYFPLTGGTFTGPIATKPNQYMENSLYGLNMNNSDIVGINGLYFGDVADGPGEGLMFKRSDNNYDQLYAEDGKLHFTTGSTPSAFGVKNTVLHSGNYSSYALPLHGIADTATKLAAARTIALSGDVTGSTIFDGSGNVSITATVVDDSHNHIISNVDGLQTALDGKVSQSISTSADLNTITTSGFYRVGNTNANMPSGGSYGQLIVSRGADTITQIIGAYGSGKLYTRSGNPSSIGGRGGWTDWKEIIDSSTIGSQSVNYATSAGSATTAINVLAQAAVTNVNRHIWFSDSENETKRAYDDDFKYNPSTNVLTVGSITGNADTATKPLGFNSRQTSISWGTLANSSYTYITRWDTSNRGSVAFADKDGQISMQIDGNFYQNEGNYKVLDTSTGLQLTGGTMSGQIAFPKNSSLYPLSFSAGNGGAFIDTYGNFKATDASAQTWNLMDSGGTPRFSVKWATGDTIIEGALSTKGRLTASGKISVPSSGSAWVSGMALNNASIAINTQNTDAAYHPLIAGKLYGGGVWNLGTITNKFGFYGFVSGHGSGNYTDYYMNIDGTTGKVEIKTYNSNVPLMLTSPSNETCLIDFYGAIGHLGSIGFASANGSLVRWNSGGSATYTILDSNNYSSYALPLTGGSLSGQLAISSAVNTTSPTGQSIILNGVNNSESTAKAPGIGFHIGNKNWASLKFLYDGSFRFYNSECNGYQPVYASTFYGNLSGNATTATKLATARTISLTGDVTGSTTFDGSGNVSITATVADDSHNHTMNTITNATTRYVNAGTITRKVIVNEGKNSQGYISRVALGLSNPSSAFSPAILSVGINDAGTGWTDFTFGIDGSISSPKGSFVVSSGNIDTSSKPLGFSTRQSAISWGTLANSSYICITRWDTANGGSVVFADKDGQTSMQIDGNFYQSEGNYKVLDTSTGLQLAGGTMSGSIITPKDDNKGIIPHTDNWGQIGSAEKKFFRMYASTFYGNLSGTATKATQDGDGNTITSTYLKLSGGTLTDNLKVPSIEQTGYSASITATGWYRCFTFQNTNASGLTNTLLNISRGYNYTNNESYIFAITMNYGGNINITQLAGRANSRLITKIRIDYTNSGKAYIDFYVNQTTNGNPYYVTSIGYGTCQVPTAVSTATGTTYEFTTTDGVKTDQGLNATGLCCADGSMSIATYANNEVNFGGTNNSSTIYFGYRASGSKPIPTKFIFGNTTGTADLQAKTVYLGSGTASYISSSSYTGNAASATKATQDGSGNTITSTYLKLSGGTLSGKLTASGKISVPTSGSAWISGMTTGNASIAISTQNTSGSYHPIIAGKTYNGHIWNLGTYVDSIGFYGFKSGRTENATDWGFVINVSSGAINASGSITAASFHGSGSGLTSLNASNISSGTLAVARGGTGITSNPSMLINLGSTSAANVFATSPRPGITGTLGLANGGTGKTTAKDAANAFINALDTGSSAPVDADYYICQYAGGGTSTITYHRRPTSALWTYMKGKIDTTYYKTVTKSGAIGSVTLADKTDYTYTGVTSLTLVYPSGNFECWLSVTTSTSAITLSFPSGTKFIGASITSLAANTTYEISIKNKVAIIKKVE